MPNHAFLGAVLLLATAVGDRPPPKYTIDLDAPASQRWTAMMTDVIKQHGGWNSSFGPLINQFSAQGIPIEDWRKHDRALQLAGLAILGAEYMEEIRGAYSGISSAGYGNEITTGMLVFIQLGYEFAMGCSGVVAHDDKGHVIHGRNIDSSAGVPHMISNITAEVTWTSKGKAILKSTQFLGYFGVHTGMRLNGWSVQSNSRVVLEPGPWGWEYTVLGLNIIDVLRHYRPAGYLLREALLKAPTFTEAVSLLSTTKEVSPLFLILAGANPGEGAVISRNREGLANNPLSVQLLGNSSADYLAQTNWDPWIPIDNDECLAAVHALPARLERACHNFTKIVYGDPGGCERLCNLTSDGRAEALKASMNKLSPGDVSPQSVLEAMSTPPVLAPGTMFTAIMQPHNNEYRTIVHDDAIGLDMQNYFRQKQSAAGLKLVKWFLQLGSATAHLPTTLLV